MAQVSPTYQKIEAEYAARDKWVASQQAEGKLADTKPAEILDSVKATQVITQPQQLDQQDIAVISPMQITHPDPGIMPAERWENIKNTLPVNAIEQKQTPLVQAKAFVNDTIQFAKADWANNNNAGDSFSKGLIEGFARDVKNEDSYTPVQKFFQEKSNQINSATLSAIKGLDVAYANPNGEKRFLQLADQISIGTMKGCIVAGSVVAQTLLDVGKFGSEIPKIMANAVLATDSLKTGDYKQALRYTGDALGGVGREAARLSVVGSVISNTRSISALNAASKIAADFYVTPQGVAIPANGYRYISATSPQLSSIINNGVVPANPKGTYFSFDKIDNFSDVADKLQHPIKDLQYRVEFDTAQTLSDLRIPNSRYGLGDIPEPITNSFMEHGSGGVTQAVTNSAIKIKRVIDLKTGEVVSEF